jgi:hypothetical protein
MSVWHSAGTAQQPLRHSKGCGTLQGPRSSRSGTAKAAAAQPKKRQKRAKPSAATRKALLADGEFGLLRFQVGAMAYALKPIQEAELQNWASEDVM